MTERADVLNNQAILLARDGQFTDAIACLRRAIHIDRTNYLVWYNLGITYRDAGDLMEALEALRNAVRISPEKEDVVETISVLCMQLHMMDEAFAYCQDGLDFHPLSERLWNLMGVLQFNSDDLDCAAESFEMAITINPYYLDALYNLFDTYTSQNNTKAADIIQQRIKELKGKRK